MRRFDLGRPSAATDREEKMGIDRGGGRGLGVVEDGEEKSHQ